MKHLKLFLFFIALMPTLALAKSNDKNEPVHIEADQLEMHQKDNISIYRGNVKITKGSLKITGEKIIITNKNGELHQIKINGEPATFFQMNDLNEEIQAESFEMDYLAKSGILELKKKALLVKNKNRFSSEHIIYNTFEDIIKAGKNNSTNKADSPRVKITLHPEANTEKQ